MTVKKIVNLMTTLDGSSFSQLETKKGLPLYVLRHPIDGCEQFRNRDLTCIPIAWFIIVALFLIETISYFSKAFIFGAL